MQQNCREPLELRKKNNILGPEELLNEIKERLIIPRYETKVKGFANIEKHNPKDYKIIYYRKSLDKVTYEIPEPVLIAYFILMRIFN